MATTIGPLGITVAAPFARWALRDGVRAVGRVPSVAWLDPSVDAARLVIHLVFGGRAGGAEYRIGSESITSTIGGVDASARAGLLDEPPIESSYTLGDGTSGARSLTVTIPADVFDVPTLLRSGVVLHGIAEVSLELPRQFSDVAPGGRFVVLRGVIDGVKWGASSSSGVELVEVQVVDPRELVRATFPPWVVDVDRFATVHASGVGARVPVVVNGYPGVPGIRVTSNTTGQQRFIFAGSTGWAVDTTDGVRVNGVAYTSADGNYGWHLRTGIDGLGAPYSEIYFDKPGTVWSDSDAVHVVCTRANGVTINVIEAIRAILRDYSPFGEQGLNARLFSEEAARLPVGLGSPAILLNAAGGGASASAIEAIEQGILGSYPMISMVWEEGGYGPILTDYRAEPVAELVAGAWPIFDRASLVQSSPVAQVANGFLIRYDYDPILDVFQGVVRRDASNSGVCEWSAALVGQRDAEVLESVLITDATTAEYVADWLVAHRAVPSYVVEYEAHAVAWFTLRRGDPVRITDPELGWTDERATVEATEYRRGYALVRLRVWQRAIAVAGAARS